MNPLPQFPGWTTPALLACALLLALAGCSRSSKPVAKVDGTTVTAEQWSVFLEGRGIAPDASPAELRDALDRLVRRTKSALLAEREGLLKGEDWQAELRDVEETALLQAYLEVRKGEALRPTEEEVRALYRERGEERRLRRIVCDSEARASEAATKVRSGLPFEKAAKNYSLDEATSAAGGEAGWVRRGDLPDPLASAVFGAGPGEVVGPLQVGRAWIVVEVAEVKEPPAGEFEKARQGLSEAVRMRKLSEARDDAGRELSAKGTPVVHEGTLADDPSLEVKPGDEAKIAAEAGDLKVPVSEAKRFCGAFFAANPSASPQDPELRKKLLEELVRNRQMTAAARADGVEGRPRTKALLWDAREEAASRRYAENYLKKLEVPESTLSEFYEQNRDAFKVPPGMRLQMLGAPSPEVLGEGVRALEGGESLESVMGRLGTKGLQATQETGSWIPETALPEMVSPQLAEALVRAPVGRWIGPVPGEGDVRAIRVVERSAGRVVPFAEAASEVRGAYLMKNGRDLVTAHLDGPGGAGLKVETFPENLTPATPEP